MACNRRNRLLALPLAVCLAACSSFSLSTLPPPHDSAMTSDATPPGQPAPLPSQSKPKNRFVRTALIVGGIVAGVLIVAAIATESD